MLNRLAGGEGAASLGQPSARASARLPARQAHRTEFNRYYLTAYPRLVAEQHALLGDGARARAAVQRAMTSAWRQWETVRELPDPMRWMRRTASLLATERRRPGSSAGELSRLASARDARPAVLNVLAELPAVQRRALVLHHMAGLSVPQVADEEGTGSATIETRLAHGQFTLARKLGAQNLIPRDAQRDPDARWAAIQHWVGRELHALTVRLSPTDDNTPEPATFERMAGRQRATAGAAAAVALVGAVSATMATQLSSESMLNLLEAGGTGAVPEDGLAPGPASPELGAPDTPVIAPTSEPGPAELDPTALLRPAPGPVIPVAPNAAASGNDDSRGRWWNDSDDDGDHDHSDGDGDGDRGRSWHRGDHDHDHGHRPPWAQWPPGGSFPWPGEYPPGPWQPPGQPRPPAPVAETRPAPQPEQSRMNMFAQPGNSVPESRPGTGPSQPSPEQNNPGQGQPSTGQSNAGQDQQAARQQGSPDGQRGSPEGQQARPSGGERPSAGGRHRRADDDGSGSGSGSRGSDSDSGSRGSGRHRDSGESRGDSDGDSGGSRGSRDGGGSHDGGGSRGDGGGGGGGGGSRGGGGGHR